MRPLFLLLAAALNLHAADWPQWRGPLRNGVVPDSPKLLVALSEEGLKELWESEQIPSNDEGGLSSPVVAGGRVTWGWCGIATSRARRGRSANCCCGRSSISL